MKWFELSETDGGSKQAAVAAIKRVKEVEKREFPRAIDTFWGRVRMTAAELCPTRTGTLKATIRIVRTGIGGGIFYEVQRTPEGFVVDRMIVAGGLLINPMTGKICDYAQAVHDGTMYQKPKPFLTDALAMNEPLLDAILKGYETKIGMAWEEDQYAGAYTPIGEGGGK